MRKLVRGLMLLNFFCLTAVVGQAFGGPLSAEMLQKLSSEQRTQLEQFQATQKSNADVQYQKTGPSIPVPETDRNESVSKGERKSGIENYFSSTMSKSQTPRQQVKTDLSGLKQFGFEFFSNVGEFTADSAALVGPDYILGPGDALRIDVWGNIEGHYQATLDRNGEIVLPKVGVIPLWGLSFAHARDQIHKHISKYFKKFQVNVSLDSLRAINVFLVGEVVAPGSYQISALNTVLTALSAAGGPAKTGSLRQVKVMRQGHEVACIDFYDFFRFGDNGRDIRLQSGDTILVPVAKTLVGVAGKVRRPAIYELLQGETLGDLLAMAGGVESTAYLPKVRIERVEDHSRKVVVDVALQNNGQNTDALELQLQDRDLVELGSIADSGGYVSLEGYVARPGKYQLTPGMHLRDLIVDYDNLLPEYYPKLAQLVRIDPPEYRPQIMTVNLQGALQGLPQHNVLLQEYDKIRLFSRQEMEELPHVTVSGAVLKAGTYRLYDKMTVKDLLTAAGNLKRDAYLGEAELTRYVSIGKETQSELITINLDRVLSGDLKDNILLRPYDHLVVRAIPDLSVQRKVEVHGKVLLPGSYTIARGEKLSSVLTRAGGFAEEAYLRGAILTRESAKKIQKKRLDKLIFEQEQEISRVAADIAAGALSPEEAQSAQTIMASRQAAVNKLKKMPLTGRLVVHLAPLEELAGSVHDIEMKSGDEIFIPENPKSVTVLGQVYNQISLIEEPGKTVSYYLSRVGGPTVNADEDQMFIVRADGTIYSKQQSGFGVSWDGESSRWLMGGFNSTRLYSGDTLLVPEKLEKTQWMQETKDISTIVYQMALGAAAVASF